MAYEVIKKGRRYAVVRGDGRDWVINLSTSVVVSSTVSPATAVGFFNRLESGEWTEDSIGYQTNQGRNIRDKLPASVIPGASTTSTGGASGKESRRGFISKDHGTFMTVQMPDGSYGYVLRDGTVVGGFRSPSGATLSGKRAVEVKFRARLGELGLDPGESATDTLLGHYRRRVEGVFSRAEDEMRVKLGAFMRKYEEDRQAWEARVASGRATQEAFDSWLEEQARQQGRMTGMADRLAQTLADADSVAVGAINGYLPSAYAENFNYATYQVESGTGTATSFTLYDSSTVARLLRDDPKLLPERKTDEGKDLAWNRRKVTEAVTQGILQGESVDKVAARLGSVLSMDKRAALRAARTALTGAQNAGRVDAYARAKDMGIDLKQEWQATYDQRTRHTHAALDGERIELGETFSNGLRYPGDPDGPPSEVYNCRCTLVPILGGLDDGGKWRKDVTIGDETYDQWKARHADAAGDVPAEGEAARTDHVKEASPARGVTGGIRYGEFRGLSYWEDELQEHVGDGSDLDPIRMVMEDTGFSEDRAYSVLSDVTLWVGEDYKRVRAGEAPGVERGLEEFMAASPKYKGTVWRGIAVERPEGETMLEVLRQGGTLDNRGIASWATEPDWASEYMSMNVDRMDDPVGFVFELGENRSGVSIKHLAEIDNDEVIAPRGVLYEMDGEPTLTKDPYDGEYWLVKVREVAR